MPIVDISEYTALFNTDPTAIMAKYDNADTWEFGDGIWDETWQYDNGLTTGEVGRIIFGGDLTSVGVPLGRAFDAASAFVGSDPLPGQVATQLAKVIWDAVPPEVKVEIMADMTDAVLQLFGGVIEGAKTVPVWGQVVGAIWDAGIGIYRIVRLVKKQNRPFKEVVKRQIYVPSNDSLLTRNIQLAVVPHQIGNTVSRGDDLTYIFRPPSLGEGPYGGDRFSLMPMEGGGYSLRGVNPSYGPGGKGGLGFLPQYNQMHGIVEVPKPVTPASIVDAGRNYPTTRGVASVVRSIGSEYAHPFMYRVNWTAVRGTWEQYLLDLRVFLHETKKISDSTKQTLISWLAEDPRGPMFGWSTSMEGPRAGLYEENWGINDLEGKWDGTPRQARPVKFAQMMRNRQEAGLATINVAYLKGEGAFADPGLAGPGNDDLLALWNTNRDKLLSHPALCSVDLQNVPDVAWRLAAESKLVDPMSCAPNQIIAAIPTDIDPMPPPVFPGVDAAVREPGFWEEHGLKLLGGALLGLGGYALYRRRTR